MSAKEYYNPDTGRYFHYCSECAGINPDLVPIDGPKTISFNEVGEPLEWRFLGPDFETPCDGCYPPEED